MDNAKKNIQSLDSSISEPSLTEPLDDILNKNLSFESRVNRFFESSKKRYFQMKKEGKIHKYAAIAIMTAFSIGILSKHSEEIMASLFAFTN